MARFPDVRELAAWQLAREVKIRVDIFLCCPEFRRHFQFCDQLGDAAGSGPRHIAEGHERFSHREFARLVRMARGSEAQVLNHLADAHAQRLITADEFAINEQLIRRAMQAAAALICDLESTPDRPGANPCASPARTRPSPAEGVAAASLPSYRS